MPFDLEALRRTDAPLATALPLPRAAYLDDAWFRAELALLEQLPRAVASLAELAQPGRWTRVPDARRSLVALRGADLTARLLLDVCRHRGAQLLDGAGGSLPKLCLRCPYHGWVYDTAGAALSTPGSDDNSLALDALPGAEALGQLWTPRAPELPPWLAALVPGALRRAHASRWEVCANWKLVVANFQESHHFASVHPALERCTPWRSSHSLHEARDWLAGVMPLADDRETVSPSGQRDGRPWLVPEGSRREVRDALLFPLTLTSLQPDYLLVYRLVPMATARTLVEHELWLHRAAPESPALAALCAFWQQVHDEDRSVCERQQRGIAGGTSEPWGRYTSSEDGVHAFDRRVAQWLLGQEKSS